jgi:hypothetical protein
MTVDEAMLTYKVKYCRIRQYLPKKLIRFGIKIWATADTLSKYLWDFEIYCGKSGNPHDDESIASIAGTANDCSDDAQQPRPGKGEGFMGQNVVKNVIHIGGPWPYCDYR